MSDFKPWDRVRYPEGYHTQLNAQAREEARAVMRRALVALAQSSAGTDDTLLYLAERVESGQVGRS